MEIRNKMIRRVTSDSYGTSNLTKRLASLLIFSFYLSLTTVILFRHITIPDNMDDAIKNVWIIPVVFLMWHASKISNYNLHVAYNSSRYSFLFSLLVIIYITVFVFWIEGLTVNKIIDVLLLSLWIIGLKIFSIIWCLIFILFERRTRPFFAKSQIFRILYDLMNIGTILIFTYYLVPEANLSDFNTSSFNGSWIWIKNGYLNNNFEIIGMTTLLVVLFICQIFFILLISIYTFKVEKILTRVSRILSLYSFVLKLGPIVIWFISNITIQSFTWKEITYIAVIYTMSLLTFIISLTKKESGGASKVYLLFSTTTLFIIISLLFGMVVWANMNLFYSLSFAFPALLFIGILNIFIEPELPLTYSSAYSLFAAVIGIYAIGVWVVNLFFPIFSRSLPFDVGEIILALPVLIVLYLESVMIYSSWNTFRTISKKSWQIYKYQNGKKKIKKKFTKKGVYNV